MPRMQCLNAIPISAAVPLARRLMSSLACRNLFIGGLSYDTNEAVLKGAFESHGELIEGYIVLRVLVKVICDHKSGKSKGYGFVKFESETAASKALKEMDGQLLDGRSIRVHYAQKG
ncbi:PREDICTED: glycine-rich RNA-binding protein 4, mitochondrial-like isoform X1 [Ipomoea nil]|uniref:glycine-rich RNA-binding protein 4, mitochondrial-like isoform X1 n=1 Tax=Ipomoea nil TaxID=35883 RepID=UPI0009009E88|nr:PREDICTED: glycine-rich RNA-binding protein 4, mitochondrial-like isoform X1 [Ipomoea nil]XP_019164164.1 PREDICTED: glycine-rich RNA-binding protein 4, mitochondrial-like isoform X1 [Ipomoea nil]XP_019164165.1 PREDICTED: glycine-rich RNA-binding protein 4, mitochondrial-like isoform X1 [Ipomoea nil]